ncbi:MAG: class I SAM-dependent methyltransferase [Promethearchaeota archaeon]|nr:MAG: class I SAM-dependent methyltransferase [Candidatus Lokiarchaeota archaeon]
MCLVKFIKDIQVRLEAIPGPSAIFYNALIKVILRKPELRIAQEIVQEIDKGILIDLGSGTGFLSIEVAKRAPQLNIYGIDLSRKMVEIASGNAGGIENVKFKLANAIDLPFENNSVDFIFSTGSFHHWKHPLKVFNECYRILKGNGVAWIYDGCSDSPKDEIIKLKHQYGAFKYPILSQIQKLHGFKWEIYNTKIKRLLEHTRFKKNFQMKLTDGWMKMILKKI